jgi:dTDP-4-amino-4,6-dideoxygalactose transaminase
MRAMALAQVRGLDEELEHRRHLAWELTFGLRGMKGAAAMAHGRWVHHAYARYVIRLRSVVWKRSIEDTVAALRAEGIPVEPACGPSLHTDPAILGPLGDDVRVGDDVFPVAARLPRELIALPLHAGLTSKDMDTVAAAIRKVEAHSL